MKYLFYDLEYATSAGGVMKVCEFGYVTTDENFNVLDRNNFIINPNISRGEWDYRVISKILTRSIEEYESGKRFGYYYNYIKKSIEEADCVIGHSLNNDALAINQECIRVNKPSIDYDFYDVKEFYKEYSNTTEATSVVNMLKELGINGDDKYHDAEADAYNTMLELKKMVHELDITLDEFIELVPGAKDRTENFKVMSIEENKKRKKEKKKEALKSHVYYEDEHSSTTLGDALGGAFAKFLTNTDK